MITIDRSSSVTVQEQLVSQLRYLIATGHFQTGDELPSTRALADQIGTSFHTVRKAYQRLEEERLVESRQGSGYRVRERTPPEKSERMERGAAVLQEAIQQLIGFGLDDAEIDVLFQEQLELMTEGTELKRLVFAAPALELAERCAQQIGRMLQQAVEPAPLDRLDAFTDADFIFSRFVDVHAAMEVVPRADVLGVMTYLTPLTLDRVARLLPHQTLGIVARQPQTIPVLMAELRALTGFTGQMIAASIEDSSSQLGSFVGDPDLIVYTPASRRRLARLNRSDLPFAELSMLVSRESLEMIRQVVPA